jgi:hypothetical protein
MTNPGNPHRDECLTCATDTSPGGIVWTRTAVLIDTLRRFADQAQGACCVHGVAQGLRRGRRRTSRASRRHAHHHGRSGRGPAMTNDQRPVRRNEHQRG